MAKLKPDWKTARNARKRIRSSMAFADGLPPGCTWVLVVGLVNDGNCQQTGERFLAEAKRRGSPFHITSNNDWGAHGTIPIVVVYSDHQNIADVFTALTLPPNMPRMVPFVYVRSLASGEGFCSLGAHDEDKVREVFDKTFEIASRARS